MNIPSEREKNNTNASSVMIPVHINGKTFNVSCIRGDESRIEEIAEFVNMRIRKSVSGSRTLTETGLYSMTLLALAEELISLKNGVDHTEKAENEIPVVPTISVPEPEKKTELTMPIPVAVAVAAAAVAAAAAAEPVKEIRTENENTPALEAELQKMKLENQKLLAENQRLQETVQELSKTNEGIAARINKLCETI